MQGGAEDWRSMERLGKEKKEAPGDREREADEEGMNEEGMESARRRRNRISQVYIQQEVLSWFQKKSYEFLFRRLRKQSRNLSAFLGFFLEKARNKVEDLLVLLLYSPLRGKEKTAAKKKHTTLKSASVVEGR